MDRKCLNCNAATKNNYCSVCGQKTSIHRFSIYHFVMHDLVHGVFHLDKGFLFTVKELIIRPGNSIREFIQGKRVKHFNYFTCAILLLTITHFLGTIDATSIRSEDLFKTGNVNKQYFRLVEEYAKIIKLLVIPIYAALSFAIFGKSKQNFTEHLVLNTYLISGILIIGLLFPVTILISKDVYFIRIIMISIAVLEFFYCFWFFYQYFFVFNYKKPSLIFRCFLMSLLILIIKIGINYSIDKILIKYL